MEVAPFKIFSHGLKQGGDGGSYFVIFIVNTCISIVFFHQILIFSSGIAVVQVNTTDQPIFVNNPYYGVNQPLGSVVFRVHACLVLIRLDFDADGNKVRAGGTGYQLLIKELLIKSNEEVTVKQLSSRKVTIHSLPISLPGTLPPPPGTNSIAATRSYLESGEIVLRHPLERLKNWYELIISAFDGGEQEGEILLCCIYIFLKYYLNLSKFDSQP